MNQISEIRRLLVEHDLAKVADLILASTKPSVQIHLGDVTGKARSRLGGTPDLPDVDAWPSLRRESLAFIGQIALDELPRDAGVEPLLPRTGLLSFFYDAEGQPWGFDTSQRPKWTVLYHEDTRRLTRVSNPPRPVPIVFPEFSATFKPDVTVPAMRSIELDRLELTQKQRERYFDFRIGVDTLAWNDSPSQHRLLGHPDSIQGCMQRTVQFASRDLKLPHGVYSYYEHPRAAELIPGAFDWQLLLQVDSDERLGAMWGDSGRIYFWIHRDDLSAQRFERCWLFLQCG